MSDCCVEKDDVQGLSKVSDLVILPPNMSNRFAHTHPHHYIQPPHGREVYVCVPVTQ